MKIIHINCGGPEMRCILLCAEYQNVIHPLCMEQLKVHPELTFRADVFWNVVKVLDCDGDGLVWSASLNSGSTIEDMLNAIPLEKQCHFLTWYIHFTKQRSVM